MLTNMFAHGIAVLECCGWQVLTRRQRCPTCTSSHAHPRMQLCCISFPLKDDINRQGRGGQWRLQPPKRMARCEVAPRRLRSQACCRPTPMTCRRDERCEVVDGRRSRRLDATTHELTEINNGAINNEVDTSSHVLSTQAPIGKPPTSTMCTPGRG